jgi:hypothetical protein
MANHYLKAAFYDGLKRINTDVLLRAIAEHISAKGEWEKGVVSPSLTANQCRLARLKIFLGDDPQPGLKAMHVRAGQPDPITQLNYIRGFTIEGAVVSALKLALGDSRIMGHAPSLLFRWRYQGADAALSTWGPPDRPGMVFAGHPDMMVWSEGRRGAPELELVQIKTPTIYKFERVARYGDEDALDSYRSQMATEMYIGRKMGYPIMRNHLMMVTTEGTPKISDPHCRVVTMQWDESLAGIPEAVGRQLVEDYNRAYTRDQWPEAEPAHKWDSWPSSYCRYSRLGDANTVGCTEQWAWDAYNSADEQGKAAWTSPVDRAEAIADGRRRHGDVLATPDQTARRLRTSRSRRQANPSPPPQLRVVSGTDS